MKQYICISGLNLRDNNRGTAALGYGSFNFLQKKDLLHSDQKLLIFRVVMNPFKKGNWGIKKGVIEVGGQKWQTETVNVNKLEYKLFTKYHLSIPFTNFTRKRRQLGLVAAINGGDGFSDIYNTEAFLGRLVDTKIAMAAGIPLVLLPQTIGPFKDESNLKIAENILQYADKVYARDDKFVPELKRLGVKYEQENDLSMYMIPEPWDIEIEPHSIGVNVSGLAYSNGFRTLSGQFDTYPELIDNIITYFANQGNKVYLISHSYNYQHPEANNDDLVACRQAYERLANKKNVALIDKDLISPQVKYIISKMSFFIGTRMHANFAAIFTGVPLFGLAYSYKFAGAFDKNGLDSEKQIAMINNLPQQEIEHVLSKIIKFYKEVNI